MIYYDGLHEGCQITASRHWQPVRPDDWMLLGILAMWAALSTVIKKSTIVVSELTVELVEFNAQPDTI